MSTPDAAPVEVEGGRPDSDADQLRAAADWLDTLDRLAQVVLTAGDFPFVSKKRQAAAVHAVSGTEVQTDLRRIADKLDTPPAAPTTPDIADERVRAVQVDALPSWPQVEKYASQGDPKATHYWVDRLLGEYDARRALATPSTPGAGQGDEVGPEAWGLTEWDLSDLPHSLRLLAAQQVGAENRCLLSASAARLDAPTGIGSNDGGPT